MQSDILSERYSDEMYLKAYQRNKTKYTKFQIGKQKYSMLHLPIRKMYLFL